MTEHGARRGNMVYHWKHGWIPLDHVAALSHAKGNHDAAKRMLAGRKSIGKSDLRRSPHIGAAHGPAGNVTLHDSKTGNSVKIRSEHAASLHSQGHTITAVHEHGITTRSDSGVSTKRGRDTRAVESNPGQAHLARAAELRAAADKKRAEADRIANGVGAPDRAGAMLRAKDSQRMNARMDSGLRRFTEAQRQAKALEGKAHLADGRARTAAEKQAASDLGVTAAKLAPGDMIQHKGQAHMVTKVNKATVSVPSIVGGPWEDKLPIGGISKHVKLADMKESTLRTLMSRAKGNAALQAIYTAELKRRGLPL